MRLIAAAAMLCLSAGARAEELCGGGGAVGRGVEANVLVSKEGARPARVTYVHVWTSSADGSYVLSAHYDPTEAGPGTPTSASVNAYMPVPDPEGAQAEQMEWRAGSGPWVGPGYWLVPRRIGAEPNSIRGSIYHKIADSRTFPVSPELLEKFNPGVRWEFRRLDRSGRVIGVGSVDYPPSKVITPLYEQAHAKALANLKPCAYGPPITSSPAPPPPPPPRDPAALDAEACRFFRRQERFATERKPEAGARVRIVAQPVDCGSRSVRRILEVGSIPRRERRDLAAAIQSLSDKTWCSVPAFRRMMERGWTLGAELRAPGDPAVIAATTRKCPAARRGSAKPGGDPSTGPG